MLGAKEERQKECFFEQMKWIMQQEKEEAARAVAR